LSEQLAQLMGGIAIRWTLAVICAAKTQSEWITDLIVRDDKAGL